MIGRTISHYRVLEKLGEGGMGVVYRAEDTKLGRTVALKFLPPELTKDSEAKQRFVREAQSASSLSHPHITTIYEIDEAEGLTFIAMECIEGGSLKKKIHAGPLPLDEAIGVAIQVAEGLQEAHEKGIVHRDIKPDNVMVTPKGQAKIMDFGLARSAGKTTLTKEGTTLGTVAYMSPEQARGEAVDHRTDIWSLGVVLYEMITGRLPFRGDHEPAIVYSILNEDPEPPTAVRTGVPMELERIVGKCLAKEAGGRFQRADELLVDLRSLARGSERAATAPRPEKRERSRVRTVLIAVGVLVAFAAASAVIQRIFYRGAPSAIDSIAVLPLENLSGDPEQEYFADGMTEALIADLAKISALRVISRTSAMRYKGTDKSLPQIARELNVQAIVEGAVVQAEGRVRITAQLIHAPADKHLWAESYERDLTDVLALQGAIARAIAQEIRVALTPQEEARLTSARRVNPEAFQLYLTGRYHLDKRSGEGLRKAVEFFRESIEKDPAYAEAYAGLADSYTLLANYGFLRPMEVLPKAKAAALQALEIDETIAEAHTSLARIRMAYDYDWDGAERGFQRAIELNPGHALSHQWYAALLCAKGRLDEAFAEKNRAQELDPLSLSARRGSAFIYYFQHRYDEAIAETRKVLEMDPGLEAAYWDLGLAFVKKEMHQEAIAAFERGVILSGSGPSLLAGLGYAYGMAKFQAEALEVHRGLMARAEREYVSPYDLAILAVGLGEKDEALTWLEEGFAVRAGGMSYVGVDPVFDHLHDDPRFEELLNNLGLEP
ncbi:MAG: protein kinase [Candidatus Eisenbacteria bacterium]